MANFWLIDAWCYDLVLHVVSIYCEVIWPVVMLSLCQHVNMHGVMT